MKPQKYYTVWAGRKPAVYNNWFDCQDQVKNFRNAEYMSFATIQEAEEAFKGTYREAVTKRNNGN